MSEVENAAVAAKTQLTVSGIKSDLNNGLSRIQIQAKYALSTKDMKDIFSHPKLKGLKTRPTPSFVLTDDTEDAVEEVAETVTENTNSSEEEISIEEEF